jgi:hypothetical protein
VGLPLPDVDAVHFIGIDGRRTEMNAGHKGLTLSVGEDPILLLYEGGAGLADALAAPAAAMASIPSAIVKGAEVPLAISLSGADAAGVSVVTPPSWTVFRKDASSAKLLAFGITSPQVSEVRQCELLVPIRDASGNISGLHSALVPVTGQLSMQVLPEPAVDDRPAGVRLAVKNNGPDKQEISWQLGLVSETPIVNGIYDKPISPSAFLGSAAEGTTTVEAGAVPPKSTEVVGDLILEK